MAPSRWISIVAFGLGVVPALAGEPTAEQYGIILNMAGRERMQIQRMCKETFLLAVGVEVDRNRKSLRESTELFEKALGILRDGDTAFNLPPAHDPKLIRQFDLVKALYEETKPIFLAAIAGRTLSREGLAKLEEWSLKTLEQMDKAVQILELEAVTVLPDGRSLAVQINVAGRQRMLSQKMLKEALLVRLGIDPELNRRRARDTCARFCRAMEGLLDGDADLNLASTTEPGIRYQIGIVSKRWRGFRAEVLRSLDEKSALSDTELAKLAADNLELLTQMNKTVKMYETLTIGG